MRILSPNNALPVFLLLGSTDKIAIVLLSKSTKNLRTNSSTNDDFPAPPVPVIPNTGVLFSLISTSTCVIILLASGVLFSTAEINRAMLRYFSCEEFFSFNRDNLFSSPFKLIPVAKSLFSTRSFIIPCKPKDLPSSGEYILVIPYFCNSSISVGRIVPPPPPKIFICPAPFSCRRSYIYLKYSVCPP